MTPRDLDDFLVDRVFQPIHDRLPKGAEGFIAIGAAITSAAGYALLGLWPLLFATAPLWAICVVAAHLHGVEADSAMPVARMAWKSRIMGLGIDITLSGVIAMAPHWYGVSLTVSMFMLTVMSYLAACRRNPPKRKKAKAPMSSVVMEGM